MRHFVATLQGYAVARLGNWFNACGGTISECGWRFLGGGPSFYYSCSRGKISIPSFIN